MPAALRQILGAYIEHQKEVVTRRTIFDKEKAEARAHILEGLLIALDHIDEVIRIIRNSQTDAEAQAEVVSKFKALEAKKKPLLAYAFADLERGGWGKRGDFGGRPVL